MRRKSLILTVILLLALALVACGGNEAEPGAGNSNATNGNNANVVDNNADDANDGADNDADMNNNADDNAGDDAADGDDAPDVSTDVDCASEDVFCVGLVTDVGEVDDKSFNQSAWEAVQQAETDLGAYVQFVETKDAKDYGANIALFGDSGYDVIVTVGFALGLATQEAAVVYPDIDFVGVDQFQAPDPPVNWVGSEADAIEADPPEGWEGNWPLPNVAGIIFPEDQAGFLAGALAGMLTESNTIAAVLGTDLVPPVVAFKEGYEAGAAYVNEDIEVISTYHPGGLDVAFTDPGWGSTTAAQAIDQGADVVFGAGGKTGNGALIEVASNEGLYCIGVDTDQWLTVPEAHPCLVTSAMKLITPAVFELVEASMNGSFPSGLYIGDVGLAPFHDFESEVGDEINAQLDEIEAGLQAGEISTGYAP